MTIVLQHQFWDLGVTEHAFEVGLSFNGVPERLLIPFDALTGFFDPSVQFGLKFAADDAEDEAAPEAPAAAPVSTRKATRGAGSEPAELQPKKPPAPIAAPKGPARSKERPAEPAPPTVPKIEGNGKERPEGDAEPAARIVSLDAFRKKN
jgi:hypothetical protein